MDRTPLRDVFRHVLKRVPRDADLDVVVLKGRCSDAWARLWNMQWASNHELNQL